MPSSPVPPGNRSSGWSAPFQFNSKPNSSPQCTLQRSKSKKASHPDQVVMLSGVSCGQIWSLSRMPGLQIDSDHGKGTHSSKQAMYFAPWSPWEIFVQTSIVSMAGHSCIIISPDLSRGPLPIFFNSRAPAVNLLSILSAKLAQLLNHYCFFKTDLLLLMLLIDPWEITTKTSVFWSLGRVVLEKQACGFKCSRKLSFGWTFTVQK